MPDSLSIEQARKLVLLSQRLPPKRQSGSAVAATQAAIEHLGYVQMDTISVVQRAHHHTLWNRNPRYRPAHLDQLVSDKQVFEYWSHAAAYLPMPDYRFSLPRKQAFACGEQEHWYACGEPLMKAVLKRITDEGPLMARDFEGEKTGVWKSKPAKRALENLFMQGDLMIPQRINFHKVYDLTERSLPEGIDTTRPSDEEHARFLITRYLQANGLGQAAEISYLLKGIKPLVSETLSEMEEAGELQEFEVGGERYFALPDLLALLVKPLTRSRLKILSPFDNLLIQRKRMQRLFDFDYLIECYLPKEKRQHGYFSLPILWDGRLVARMDCKAERKEAVLHIYHLVLEPGLASIDEFAAALGNELAPFARFQGCQTIQLHQTTPSKAGSEVARAIKQLSLTNA